VGQRAHSSGSLAFQAASLFENRPVTRAPSAQALDFPPRRSRPRTLDSAFGNSFHPLPQFPPPALGVDFDSHREVIASPERAGQSFPGQRHREPRKDACPEVVFRVAIFPSKKACSPKDCHPEHDIRPGVALRAPRNDRSGGGHWDGGSSTLRSGLEDLCEPRVRQAREARGLPLKGGRAHSSAYDPLWGILVPRPGKHMAIHRCGLT
jgi:hypothetical protein